VPEEPHREHLLKIGVSGVRGVVGEFFTPSIACAFAQAFGTYVGGGRVVVGRDTRTSGPMLTHAVTSGLLAAGCEVVHLGIIPTPSLQAYIAATRARGGLAITASHNPSEYNAVKLFNAEGLFFNGYERSELLDLYHQRSFTEASNAEIRGVSSETADATRYHLDRVLTHIDVARVRARNFTVALDGVNGAGSVVTPGFLQNDLGCTLHAMSVDPTEVFPRVPEPRPELVGGGEILQPALYALAAEKILGEPVAFGRLYYSTIAQNYTAIDVSLNDWARHRAAQVLRVIDDAMRVGFLPAAPRKDGCKRCEFLPVCGPYEEERVAEKSQPELKALKELRTWR